MKGKFIIIGRYWNDIDWVGASLDYIDQWNADEVYLLEGHFGTCEKVFKKLSQPAGA